MNRDLYRADQSNNEVLAREGIDTVDLQNSTISFLSNNEVLAREGIDTYLENM